MSFELGVETEIYVFRQESLDAPNGPLQPIQRSGNLWPTPAYDLEVSLDLMPFLDPMVRYMTETGFGVFSFDAEGGEGQVEFDFAHAPVLDMADRLTLFRLMAKQVAKESGLAVTFMPKPWSGAWGSGAHFNMSLTDLESGANLFRSEEDPRGFGWSRDAYAFAAGLIRHAGALAAVATPTVNSFKRLTPELARGEVSWAPIWAAYGINNRSCMLRFPGNRPALENRAVDSAANAYVTAAMMLAAGLEGIEAGLDPGDPTHERAYGEAPVGAGGAPAAQPARGHRRLRRGPAHLRGLPGRVRGRLHRHEAARVGGVPRRGRRVGAPALPDPVLTRPRRPPRRAHAIPVSSGSSYHRTRSPTRARSLKRRDFGARCRASPSARQRSATGGCSSASRCSVAVTVRHSPQSSPVSRAT